MPPQINIAFQTLKFFDDLAPTYLIELIEKRCRTRILENSDNILKIPLVKRVRHGTNSFCFLLFYLIINKCQMFYVTLSHIFFYYNYKKILYNL